MANSSIYAAFERMWQNFLLKISNKMDTVNPVGTGTFSMNRREGSDIGIHSYTEGYNCTASGENSHAEGNYTEATGESSHAEGYQATASGYSSHAENVATTASGEFAHAEGFGSIASGNGSHVEGFATEASGQGSHAEGNKSTASGSNSHVEGYGTNAASENQHVQGTYNIADANNKYAHIVGNGSFGSGESNAHTLDWKGNAWFAGEVYVGSTSGTNKDAGSKKLTTEESVHNILIATGLITPEDIDAICGATT